MKQIVYSNINPSKPSLPLTPAFTIVELLIVIVIIGILATISIVAYNGVTTSAAKATVKSDLKNAATQLGMTHAENGFYPGTDNTITDGSSSPSLTKSDGTTFQYTRTAGGTAYCLTATSNKSNVPAYYISSTNQAPTEGTCPGHTGLTNGGSGGSGTIAANTPIQNVTSSQCSALPIYTGTNEDAVFTTTDSRGGTTRTYRIAKLADNHCWMLDNLKLGSTSTSITLTPSDTNITANFTLPQVQTSGSASYDSPTVSGPVPGDTGSGATNYGYLYNWSAATAGETRTSTRSGNAAQSVCPANWRLPTGGAGGEFAQLDQAFGGMGTYTESGQNIAKWQHDGPFKGSFAGNWVGGFSYQGWYGRLWSSSAYPSGTAYAFYARFGANEMYPDSYASRSGGYGVRCLAKVIVE